MRQRATRKTVLRQRPNVFSDCSSSFHFCHPKVGSGKEVCFGPSPDPEGTLGTRMGPGRAGMAPTSGPGWVRNAVKQRGTWRIWTGPLRTRDGTWTGPGSDPGEGLDGTPRNSNRLLGLSEKGLLCAPSASVAALWTCTRQRLRIEKQYEHSVHVSVAIQTACYQRRAEYGFGEYGFKTHRTQ